MSRISPLSTPDSAAMRSHLFNAKSWPAPTTSTQRHYFFLKSLHLIRSPDPLNTTPPGHSPPKFILKNKKINVYLTGIPSSCKNLNRRPPPYAKRQFRHRGGLRHRLRPLPPR